LGRRLAKSCYPHHVFTGLVETTGTLSAKREAPGGIRLGIEHALGDLELGESIAVNGVCLTVVSSERVDQLTHRFEADVSTETMRVTTLGEARLSQRLNLERALGLGDRIGGHWVSGHVDGVLLVQALDPSGDALAVEFRAPEELLRYVAPKGSVTVDGVSLTVNRVSSQGFSVMLIPHTRMVTTLGELALGSRVNFEVDLLARYVCRYLELVQGCDRPAEPRGEGSSFAATLKRSGFM
jgi:riboflavin synthase